MNTQTVLAIVAAILRTQDDEMTNSAAIHDAAELLDLATDLLHDRREAADRKWSEA